MIFKKKPKEKSIAEQNKELEDAYKLELNKSRVENLKNGKDYENLTINKNLVLISEAEKNEAEKKKAESQTQSKIVNGIQVGCTVAGTAATIALWRKDQKEGNATRTEVGKTIANYGRNIMSFFKKK